MRRGRTTRRVRRTCRSPRRPTAECRAWLRLPLDCPRLEDFGDRADQPVFESAHTERILQAMHDLRWEFDRPALQRRNHGAINRFIGAGLTLEIRAVQTAQPHLDAVLPA